MRNQKKTSKFLSLILRHRPEAIGITLDRHGWADVEQVLKGVKISMAELEEIVASDEKQRYRFSEDKTRIRANQGHSIPVDLELEEREPPEFLYHGTIGAFLDSIRKQGLQRQSRQYVHLSKDVETAAKVGGRRGKPVVLQVAAGRMYADGRPFYLSENGVWLTGEVPPAYIKMPDHT
ncbi:MAG: RNA 2'-phosphotransferase [Oscillibacter sp.]|nr:RNA 2'-phosphotransferase [Oscillibacter sp.]MCI9375687.1 RNA 2'-phosphotransferase [Oscillibacter sp.]